MNYLLSVKLRDTLVQMLLLVNRFHSKELSRYVENPKSNSSSQMLVYACGLL